MRGIQYTTSFVMDKGIKPNDRPRLLGRPVKPDDDAEFEARLVLSPP
jgi:hypothetical protein